MDTEKQNFTYNFQIMLNNPDNLERKNEPVITKLNFADYKVHRNSLVLFDDKNNGNVSLCS